MLKYLALACLLGVCYVAGQQQQGDKDAVLLRYFADHNQNKNQASTLVPPVTQPMAVAGQQQQGYSAVLLEIFGDPNQNKNQASTLVPPVTQPTNPEDLSCKMDDGTVGECVNYYLCKTKNTVIKDGEGVIDIRVRDGLCPFYEDVCCVLPDKRTPDNPITPSPSVQPTREVSGQWNQEGVGFKTIGDKDGEAKFRESIRELVRSILGDQDGSTS